MREYSCDTFGSYLTYMDYGTIYFLELKSTYCIFVIYVALRNLKYYFETIQKIYSSFLFFFFICPLFYGSKESEYCILYVGKFPMFLNWQLCFSGKRYLKDINIKACSRRQISLWGNVQTTWAEFWAILTPSPLCGHFY